MGVRLYSVTTNSTFRGIANGWKLIVDAIKVFYFHPVFAVPLLITWCIYVPSIMYYMYWFDESIYTKGQQYLILTGFLFALVLLLSFSCSILLELIQQHESGKKKRFFVAVKHTLTHNLFRMLPLIIVWTVIWLVLTLLQSFYNREPKQNEERLSVEELVRILAGYQRLSLSRAVLKGLEKGVRMIVFLILPAIAWEGVSFSSAVKKGVGVFQVHLSEFATGFTLTTLAQVVMFAPPMLLAYISKMNIEFPEWVWISVIFYIVFAWSFTIYLEQMFCAQLYLWHMKWEDAVRRSKQFHLAPPAFYEVAKPTLLDEVHDLMER